MVDNTLPFEFGLDAFIGRNCCKVLGPETLMILVTLELVTPPCHSVNAKKSIHSVNPLTVTRCHSKNISATFSSFFFKDTAQRQQQAFVGSGRVGGRSPRDGGTSGSDDERESPPTCGLFHNLRLNGEFGVASEAFLSDRDWRPTSCSVGPIHPGPVSCCCEAVMTHF